MEVALTASGRLVTLSISDDGVGLGVSFAAGGPSWGLTTMHERAEAIGARVRIDSSPGAGTRVTIEVQRETT